MNKTARIIILLCLAAGLSGCVAPGRPSSFQHTTASGWASIEIRDGVEYDRAWDLVFGILSREFDFNTVLKADGYIQTAWMYTWSGLYQENYKVRVTVKFSPDRKLLQVRSEAWALAGKAWIVGTDSQLMTTMKTDLMGTVGRITR
jgi:hypothetical protein